VQQNGRSGARQKKGKIDNCKNPRKVQERKKRDEFGITETTQNPGNYQKGEEAQTEANKNLVTQTGEKKEVT